MYVDKSIINTCLAAIRLAPSPPTRTSPCHIASLYYSGLTYYHSTTQPSSDPTPSIDESCSKEAKEELVALIGMKLVKEMNEDKLHLLWVGDREKTVSFAAGGIAHCRSIHSVAPNQGAQ